MRTEEERAQLRDYTLIWRLAFPDKSHQSVREWRARNPEQRREYERRIRRENPNYDREKRAKNPEAYREMDRRFRSRHRDRLNANRRARRAEDLQFKMSMILRCRLSQAMRKQWKSGRTMEMLGCSIGEFLSHIERQWKPGMSWANHGKHGWHIDHVMPLAAFDLSDPAQQSKCFHYSNLQPLWAFENLTKGAAI